MNFGNVIAARTAAEAVEEMPEGKAKKLLDKKGFEYVVTNRDGREQNHQSTGHTDKIGLEIRNDVVANAYLL